MERLVKCDVCDKMVEEGKSLVKHMGTHGLTNLKCEHCEKSFTQQASLTRHIVTIHKITTGVGNPNSYVSKRGKQVKEPG